MRKHEYNALEYPAFSPAERGIPEEAGQQIL